MWRLVLHTAGPAVENGTVGSHASFSMRRTPPGATCREVEIAGAVEGQRTKWHPASWAQDSFQTFRSPSIFHHLSGIPSQGVKLRELRIEVRQMRPRLRRILRETDLCCRARIRPDGSLDL